MSHELDSELGFSQEAIAACLTREGLLSLELEFTRKCNLRCTYCYSSAGEALERELSPEEIVAVIEQAKRLGAKRIILLGGGEPFFFPAVREIVQHIDTLGLSQAVFTNGICLTSELCRFLFDHRVAVAVKQNSFLPAVQDELAGMTGAYAGIQRGLRLLMESGYPDADHSLCVQTVICRPNRAEIVDMWIWARERGITPYFEALTDQGRARQNAKLALSPDELHLVFQALSDTDREMGDLDGDSLVMHRTGRPGKIEIIATKPLVMDVCNPIARRDGADLVKWVGEQGGPGRRVDRAALA